MLPGVEAASSQAHPRPLTEALLEHARTVLAADNVSVRGVSAAGWVLEARFRDLQRSSEVLADVRRAQALHRSLIDHGRSEERRVGKEGGARRRPARADQDPRPARRDW